LKTRTLLRRMGRTEITPTALEREQIAKRQAEEQAAETNLVFFERQERVVERYLSQFGEGYEPLWRALEVYAAALPAKYERVPIPEGATLSQSELNDERDLQDIMAVLSRMGDHGYASLSKRARGQLFATETARLKSWSSAEMNLMKRTTNGFARSSRDSNTCRCGCSTPRLRRMHPHRVRASADPLQSDIGFWPRIRGRATMAAL
jgi:hypothetical protein